MNDTILAQYEIQLKTLKKWIEYLEPVQEEYDAETADDIIMEQIDKAHRRGIISDFVAKRLHAYFYV